jgi:hypothetical protein
VILTSMSYEILTVEDIIKNPKLLENLKSLAANGTQLQRISQQRIAEFNSKTFIDSSDSEIAFDRLKVKPTLLDDFSIGFTDNIGRIISTENVINLIKEDGRGHYLKSIEPAPNNKPEATSTPQPSTINPWVSGNRTQQLLLIQNNPERAAKLKELAGK